MLHEDDRALCWQMSTGFVVLMDGRWQRFAFFDGPIDGVLDWVMNYSGVRYLCICLLGGCSH